MTMVMEPPDLRWTGAAFEERDAPVEPVLVWVTCGRCGGQREVWHPGAFGLFALRCEACLGVGQRLVEGR